MLPKNHVLLSLIFAAALYVWLPVVSVFDVFLFFMAAVFIDVDHYIWYVQSKGDWSLKNAYNHLKKISKTHTEPSMMYFHSIEFIILIGVVGFFIPEFLFIFAGMIFHSFLDIIAMASIGRLYVREFSFIRYLVTKDKVKYL